MEYTASTYGDRIADVYDVLYRDTVGVEPVVSTLAELAGGGPALELGVGTGRIALPLKDKGLDVHGIEISEAMIAKLRAKEDTPSILITLGDFADVDVDAEYPLIFVVANTIFMLLTQEDQLKCFQNVSRHLSASGVFLIEAFVPDLTRFVHGQNMQTQKVDANEVRLDVGRHDPVGQLVTSQHIFLTENGTRMYPAQLRYAWPSELDLMARLAGLRLRDRWGDWRRGPFTARSTSHVSVYERA